YYPGITAKPFRCSSWTAYRISELLELSEEEQIALFYDKEYTLQKTEDSANNQSELNETQCSYIMGIVKSLGILYPDMKRASRRLRLPSTEFPFNGKSPMSFMLTDKDGLRLTRRYFDFIAQPGDRNDR
ncbi:MAG: hypothetical protein WD623_02520, partial [Marinobacter sp.]